MSRPIGTKLTKPRADHDRLVAMCKANAAKRKANAQGIGAQLRVSPAVAKRVCDTFQSPSERRAWIDATLSAALDHLS